MTFLNMKLELPRGMRDIEPNELVGIKFIKDKFDETAKLFNFVAIEPSPIEMLATLEAKAGPSISNDIYSFIDKGDRKIALRFDLTVGMTRFISLRRDLKMPTKVASFAGVWRYDEPQAARYRYFHQWDIELYGSFSVESDAEVIEFVSRFLDKLGLSAVIEINDLRLIEEYIQKVLGIFDKPKIREMLRALDKISKKSSEDVIDEYSERLDPEALRQLISDTRTKGSLEEVKGRLEKASKLCWRNLEELMDSLRLRKVKDTRINLGIVRGLDYYSGIVFEAFDPGAEVGAIVGGGRYDLLMNAFGRDDLGAAGAAGGIERILLALKKKGVLQSHKSPLIYVVYSSPNVKRYAIELISDLRKFGISIDYDMQGRPMRRQVQDAYSKESILIIMITEEFAETGLVTIKDVRDHSEKKLRVDKLGELLNNQLVAPKHIG
jgi:histidyl-tRNA synthetase